jgi:hypothetical protein
MGTVQRLSTGNATAAARPTRTAPAAAPVSSQPARTNASAVANRMTAAPTALPLSAIPTEWVPNGTTERRVETKSGFLTLDRGHVSIARNANSIAVRGVDNRNLGGITLRSNPADPTSITAVTPRGTFTGHLSGSGNSFDFRGNDGQHNIHIQRNAHDVRFDTDGFGKLDHGHLNVYDR